MKLSYFLSILTAIIFTFPAFGNLLVQNGDGEEDGIQFQNISFQQALQKAKKEDKLIFLDAYTSWCGPCKYMAKKTFKSSKVGKIFNKQFINIHIDMEKGEGPSVARRYRVRAYPTMLFINGEGKVVKRILGARGVDKFLEDVQSVIQ